MISSGTESPAATTHLSGSAPPEAQVPDSRNTGLDAGLKHTKLTPFPLSGMFFPQIFEWIPHAIQISASILPL